MPIGLSTPLGYIDRGGVQQRSWKRLASVVIYRRRGALTDNGLQVGAIFEGVIRDAGHASGDGDALYVAAEHWGSSSNPFRFARHHDLCAFHNAGVGLLHGRTDSQRIAEVFCLAVKQHAVGAVHIGVACCYIESIEVGAAYESGAIVHHILGYGDGLELGVAPEGTAFNLTDMALLAVNGHRAGNGDMSVEGRLAVAVGYVRPLVTGYGVAKRSLQV